MGKVAISKTATEMSFLKSIFAPSKPAAKDVDEMGEWEKVGQFWPFVSVFSRYFVSVFPIVSGPWFVVYSFAIVSSGDWFELCLLLS